MNDGVGAKAIRNPLLAPLGIALVALSLSIGWGIRGNYGHETGAMLPGALAAIAVCLLAPRADWRARVAYFACFGALGWAFGGSISYMQVIAYSQSGHAASQYYAFWGLFLIGFLWAALGAAGTALPAVLDRKSLTDMFFPLSLILALWTVLYFVENPIAFMVQKQFSVYRGPASHRHESVLYWLDSDWLSVLVILIGILVYDLVDRRFNKSLWLPVLALGGAIAGYLVEMAVIRAGYAGALRDALVRPQGDTMVFPPERLITNWPAIVMEESAYLGAFLGLVAGTAAYFALFGKFRRGSSLFLHMALGWFAGFLLFPVLLDIRLTPPRGDNWAGILGVVAGALVYFWRRKMWPVVIATIAAGTIGGIGFSGIACLEALLEAPGNKNLAPGLAEAWTNWQRTASMSYPPPFLEGAHAAAGWEFWHEANWHSFLEQSYGFVNGIGMAVAMGLIVYRLAPLNDDSRRQRWTEILALTLALPVLLYVNLVKNVADWTDPAHRAVEPLMRAPLLGFSLSAWGWFNVLFGLAALALIMLLSVHTRRPLGLLEQSWLGRGQLLYLVLLWTFVIGNFGKALAGFGEQRLLTEGVITVNAVLVTIMILLLPQSAPEPLPERDAPFGRTRALCILAAVVCAATIPLIETLCVRSVYGDAVGRRVSKDGPQMRFGPKAQWKHFPLLKGADHS